LEIVKAMIGTHEEQAHSTRQVSPLTCGRKVWVVSYGHDHRGGTLHDVENDVIWLVAYRRHRSGSVDDFFPYCKSLDRDKQLLPTRRDYERMFKERDRRFAEAVVHEAPVILREAHATQSEYSCIVGGEMGACLSIEVDDELEVTAMTVAFDVTEIEGLEQAQLLLNPADHAQLGIPYAWGIPLIADERQRRGYFRVDCEGSAWQIESELAAFVESPVIRKTPGSPVERPLAA
jgi:hypothetical protein